MQRSPLREPPAIEKNVPFKGEVSLKRTSHLNEKAPFKEFFWEVSFKEAFSPTGEKHSFKGACGFEKKTFPLSVLFFVNFGLQCLSCITY